MDEVPRTFGPLIEEALGQSPAVGLPSLSKGNCSAIADVEPNRTYVITPDRELYELRGGVEVGPLATEPSPYGKTPPRSGSATGLRRIR